VTGLPVGTSPVRGLPVIDGATLRRLVSPTAAVDALEDALRSGRAPGRTPARTVVEAAHGQVLMMPSEIGAWWGVKLVSIGPANPAAGRPRIQGVYLLLDAVTLSPTVLVDAVALTNLRTPAVSALALRHLRSGAVERLVVFGSGPQALGHLEAVLATGPVQRLTWVCRDVQRGDRALRAALTDLADEDGGGGGGGVGVGGVGGIGEVGVLTASDPELAERLAEADVVVCATTAREPLFDSSVLRADACVLAVGSHEPTAREVDSSLVARSTVLVESPTGWPQEAGDLVIPRDRGEWPAGAPAGDLSDLVAGRVPMDPYRPRFFKSTGEAWEDLVVAALAAERFLAAGGAQAVPGDPVGPSRPAGSA
jgi:ornithine cyclodeaminase/alanine dehydrogenase-like protein (mu-crystallin family)